MLLLFFRKFERLHGKSKVKPNMHFHGHLKECVLNYGPVYNFWCFSFERFNGILSSFKTNNRCIEIQLMRKLLSDHFISCSTLPKEFAENCLPLLSCSVTDRADHYWHCKFGTQAYECSTCILLVGHWLEQPEGRRPSQGGLLPSAYSKDWGTKSATRICSCRLAWCRARGNLEKGIFSWGSISLSTSGKNLLQICCTFYFFLLY